ncbi:MAG: hypothetical protein L0211_02005 [Planctomycetaceae bacterium]|nr:hypothetical protein [Planctomycetaceae bacterium]
MKPRMAALALGLGLVFSATLIPPTSAAAQSPPDPEVMRLQREIDQARAMIAKWTETLHALQKQLARTQSIPPGLRFPYDVERAMIGEGMKASQQRQLRAPSTPRFQRGSVKPPRD